MNMHERNIFTVSEVSDSIKDVLEGAFSFLKIKGEISNYKLHSSGHMYFQLKDAKSQISCVMFKGQAKVKVEFKDGDQVVLTGKISVFQARGNYQIIAYSVERLGVGQLLLAFEKLKAELKELGYFDKAKKKRLVRFPKTVGVVTSPTGAVIRDMIHVLKKPMQTFHLLINPVNVQGSGAKEQIAEAINYFSEKNNVDLIIVCRGGGSIEDLWPFNERIVAKSIYDCRIPVISAIGHETDITISDFVADYRAPTPTAAAQVVITSQVLLNERIKKLKPIMQSRMLKELGEIKRTLFRYHRATIFQSAPLVLARQLQEFDHISSTLEQGFLDHLQNYKNSMQSLKKQLELLHPKTRILEYKKRLISLHKSFKIIPRTINDKKSSLKSIYEHLQAINPEKILRKGFCIPFQENTNSIIMGAEKIKKNQNITLRFFDGNVKTHVKEVVYERKKATKKL